MRQTSAGLSNEGVKGNEINVIRRPQRIKKENGG
jgi:hypothetical protein